MTNGRILFGGDYLPEQQPEETWQEGTHPSAVIRPTRTHRVEPRTSSGAEQLAFVAGDDRVLTLKTW